LRAVHLANPKSTTISDRRRIYNYQRGAEAFRYETDGQRIVSYRRTGSAEPAAGAAAAAAAEAGKARRFGSG